MELRIKDLEEAGLTQMHRFKLLQIAAGITETKSQKQSQEAHVTINVPNETIQKALSTLVRDKRLKKHCRHMEYSISSKSWC